MESMTQECGFKINAQINWIGALARDIYVLAINIIVVLLACDDSLRELRNVRTPHRR